MGIMRDVKITLSTDDSNTPKDKMASVNVNGWSAFHVLFSSKAGGRCSIV